MGEGGGGSCGGGDAGSRLSRLRGGGHDADPVAAGGARDEEEGEGARWKVVEEGGGSCGGGEAGSRPSRLQAGGRGADPVAAWAKERRKVRGRGRVGKKVVSWG